MTVEVGDTILNGQLVVAEVDDQGNVTATFPQVKDMFGVPFVVRYEPGVTVAVIETYARALVAGLG